jgi:hypothetical protein
MQAEGFGLVRIVHYSQYEAVAVFERVLLIDGSASSQPHP